MGLRLRASCVLIVCAVSFALVPQAQATGLPDLIVTDIVMSPTTSGPGISTTFFVTVKNVGTASSTFAVTTVDFPSTFSPNIAGFNAEALAPGETNTKSVTSTPGTNDVGSLNVTATTDDPRFNSGIAVAESDESNNSRTEAFSFGPDLVVDLSPPADTPSGDAVPLVETTSNQGSAEVTSTTTKFYLSTDAVLSGTDTLLGSRTVPALNANGNSNASTNVTIPGGTSPGTYSVFAVADDGSALIEADETNNRDRENIVVLDGTPPALQIDSGPSGLTTNNQPTFTFSVESGATVQCSIDQGIANFGSCSTGTSHTPASPLADAAWTFRVRADDGFNTSTVTRSFTVDTTTPDAPTVTSTNPSSPSPNNNPAVIGSAESGSTVKVFLTSDCSGAPAATGTAAAFASPGLTITVPSNQVSQIRATATDAVNHTSSCSGPLAYTEDSTAPNAPALASTNPASPSSDNNPKVIGSAESGAVVNLFFTSNCSGAPAGSGDADQLASPGITVTVPSNQTSDIRATATDAAGNTSLCSAPISYVEDSAGPPVLTATVPASPSSDNSPEVQGTSEAGTTVKLYLTSDCSGTPAATGTAAALAGSGITATVPSDQTSSIRATATDGIGEVSACSDPISYVEDSTDPETQIDSHPKKRTTSRKATFTFSSPDPGATFECSLDGSAFAACTSGTPFTKLARKRHTFEVRAVDAAGNRDGTPATFTWRIVRP